MNSLTRNERRTVEELLAEVIKRLDNLEDQENRWVIIPIMEDMWKLLVNLQTNSPVSG